MDIKGPNLVKGIHMEGLRVLGTSERFADYYYKNGADELFYQDVVASLYQRNSLLELVEKTANAISIPLTVGGGIKSLDDISKLLDSAADKVSLNTSVIKDPKLIDKAAKKFGSSTIIIAVEHSKNMGGQHLHLLIMDGNILGLKYLNGQKKLKIVVLVRYCSLQ